MDNKDDKININILREMIYKSYKNDEFDSSKYDKKEFLDVLKVVNQKIIKRSEKKFNDLVNEYDKNKDNLFKIENFVASNLFNVMSYFHILADSLKLFENVSNILSVVVAEKLEISYNNFIIRNDFIVNDLKIEKNMELLKETTNQNLESKKVEYQSLSDDIKNIESELKTLINNSNTKNNDKDKNKDNINKKSLNK